MKQGTVSKRRLDLPTGTLVKRNAKKGNSTQPANKNRSTARYVDLKIRLPIEEYNRGLPYFGDQKNLGRFILESYRERVNRAEANDKAGRLKKLLTDEDLLMPVLKHMKETGKLNFLLGYKD